jgi:hypothetical protein
MSEVIREGIDEAMLLHEALNQAKTSSLRNDSS